MEPIMIIAMAGLSSKEETKKKETKKKLKTPMPYSGKREDLQKFLQEVKIYLLGNEGLYPSDTDKILFVISYMSDGKKSTLKRPNNQLLRTIQHLPLEHTTYFSKEDGPMISHPTMHQRTQSTI